MKNLTQNQTALGVLCTILGALLFGFTPILVQQVTVTGVSSMTVGFYRHFFCVIITLAWSFFSKQSLRVIKHQLFHLVWIGVLGVALTTITLYGSYAYLGVGTATVLHFLYPAVTALICWLVFRDKIGRNRKIGLALSCAGLVFFLQGDVSAFGIFLAVASAVAYAVYLVGMEKARIAFLPVCVVTFYLAATCAIFLGIYGGLSGQLQLAMPLPQLAMCFVISFCTSFGGTLLLQLGVRYLSAGTTALLCLIEPVSSVLFGMVILHEHVSTTQWIGSAIIVGALVVGTGKAKN